MTPLEAFFAGIGVVFLVTFILALFVVVLGPEYDPLDEYERQARAAMDDEFDAQEAAE